MHPEICGDLFPKRWFRSPSVLLERKFPSSPATIVKYSFAQCKALLRFSSSFGSIIQYEWIQ